MPTRRKLDWGKIKAAMNVPCLHCGASIAPDQQTRVDFQRMKCPKCDKIFDPESKMRDKASNQTGIP